MISITREPRYADKLRKYKVEIDDTVVGEIADGENKNFDVEPGEHTLCLRIDWARSNKVEFAASAGKTIHFKCSSRLKGPRIWLAIFYVIFLPHKYIELKEVPND